MSQLFDFGESREVAKKFGLETELSNFGQEDREKSFCVDGDEVDVANVVDEAAVAAAALRQEEAELCHRVTLAEKEKQNLLKLNDKYWKILTSD